MSQKVKITGARVHGSPVYLGDVTQPDGTVAPVWSAEPARVLDWLCDGFRFRFNQRRSTRSRYLTCQDRSGNQVVVTAPSGQPVLVPIGSTVTDISDAAARRQHSFLAAMPGYVLEATLKTESTDWFSAVKRRKTNTANGRRPGAMPGFRRRDGEQRFVCWFDGGRNAVFTRTGKRSGMVTISGANPKAHRAAGVGSDGKPHKLAWRITLHVRLSQPIRPYTSVRVNWSCRELVFVNEPLPVANKTRTGQVIGIDRGVVHTAADDRGGFYDAPDTAALDKQRKFHQRRMAKSKLVAARQGRRFWESKRYQAHKTAAAGLATKQARIREDFAHKLSTQLVRGHDFIGIEKLSLDRMTRRGKGVGAAQKRGLNRALQHAALGKLGACIEYKANLAEVPFVEVPAAYTSQRCHQCGHTCKGNRESQAVSGASRVRGRAMLTPTPPSTCVRKLSCGGRRTPNNWLGHPVRSRAGSLPSARRGARVRPTPTRVRPLGRRHLRRTANHPMPPNGQGNPPLSSGGGCQLPPDGRWAGAPIDRCGPSPATRCRSQPANR